MTIRLRNHLRWLCGFMVALSAVFGVAQSESPERSFPQSKATIEKALKAIQPNMAGRLPVLEGFAKAGEHPLDRYQRGYYQATADVVATASGGCVVRIRAKLTAWYSDAPSNSGYQLLPSNGRIEMDLLDQLSEQLSATFVEKPTMANAPTPALSPRVSKPEQPSAPEPVRKFPDASGTVSSALKDSVSSSPAPDRTVDSAKPDNSLKAEAANLEEILKNTSHPRNLVAVKKSGTAVVPSPSLTAKPLFLASMHDEFELLDFNADWVHVRISGLSRGWIWRNSLEMPEGIPDTAATSAGVNAAADLFRVVREETAAFPGDWEPLRGKNVEIVSVQKVDEGTQTSGLPERLEYAKYLLQKGYAEILEKKQPVEGIVLIFDSADGGMIAAASPVLQQWKAGTLTDSALWHKCFFDPPETFDTAASTGSK